MDCYSDEQLLVMLKDFESDRVERKGSFKSDVRKKVRQAICAMANDLPNHGQAGVVFIGAEDDGRPSGLTITDDLLCALSDCKTDGNILPMPAMTVRKRELLGVPMAVVTVMPSDMPPVKYDGRIWVRTGPRRSIANAQEERLLTERRHSRHQPYDLSPVPMASLTDLSRVRFEETYLPRAFAPDILQTNGRTYQQQLASCRMIVSPDSPVPTVMGLLALANDPQEFLPGSYIQFLRIAGCSLTDEVVDEQQMGGNIVDMLQTVHQKLQSHNRIAVDVTGGPRDSREGDYPISALHQLVYNAVLHRTYESTHAPVRIYWFDDRIEIHSPGGPYGNVTAANFGRPGITDYRNPNLAEVMKVYGFVQAFGRGIALAQQAANANGNPPVKFEVNDSAVLCVVDKREKP